MLVAATALGYGAQWLTEWYAFDADVNRVLGLGENEKVAGYLYFGSESVPKDERPRPELSEITSNWTPKGWKVRCPCSSVCPAPRPRRSA